MTYAAINMDVTASAMDLIFYAMKSKLGPKLVSQFTGVYKNQQKKSCLGFILEFFLFSAKHCFMFMYFRKKSLFKMTSK